MPPSGHEARRQPRVRGLGRMSLILSRPLTLAPATPPLLAGTTRCPQASPRVRGEGGCQRENFLYFSFFGISESVPSRRFLSVS